MRREKQWRWSLHLWRKQRWWNGVSSGQHVWTVLLATTTTQQSTARLFLCASSEKSASIFIRIVVLTPSVSALNAPTPTPAAAPSPCSRLHRSFQCIDLQHHSSLHSLPTMWTHLSASSSLLAATWAALFSTQSLVALAWPARTKGAPSTTLPFPPRTSSRGQLEKTLWRQPWHLFQLLVLPSKSLNGMKMCLSHCYPCRGISRMALNGHFG